MGQEQPQPNVRFNPDICLHCPRKMQNTSFGKVDISADLNSGSPQYRPTNMISYSFLRGELNVGLHVVFKFFFFSLRPNAGHVLLILEVFYITHNDAPQSVGLLWTSDQLLADTSTWQHKTLTTDKHPCPRWDSNPRSQPAKNNSHSCVYQCSTANSYISPTQCLCVLMIPTINNYCSPLYFLTQHLIRLSNVSTLVFFVPYTTNHRGQRSIPGQPMSDLDKVSMS